MRHRLLITMALLVAWGVAAVAFAGDDERGTVTRTPAPVGPPEAGDPSDPATADAGAPPATGAPPLVPEVVLVRRAQGVPERWTRRALATRGVQRVVRVRRGQALLTGSFNSGGGRADRVRRGYAIPLDTLVANPRSYAAMLPSDVGKVIAGMGRGEAVLSRTGARLRGLRRGAKLVLAGGARLRVTAVVDDADLNGAELLIVRDGRGVETRAAHLLVRVLSPRVARSLRREFRGERVRVVARSTSPRDARGTIARPAELKERFGEVAVKLPYGADHVALDPGWVRRNIATRSVPLLGRVTCNRKMLGDLAAALSEVRRKRLGKLVDPGDYAGCYAPRRIPSSGSLSLHALGLAVDLNASRNGQYSDGDQDPRLVSIMERHGFTWGGRWPTAPDPMHFEWQG